VGISNDEQVRRRLTGVTVLLLERLDESNVLLLSVGRRDTLVNQLLPCVSLGLALLLRKRVSGVFRLEEKRTLRLERAGRVLP
jgi:hypothetical protein